MSLAADARALAAQKRGSFQFGYVPPNELAIDPSLTLHQINESEADLDPITYEVIRSKLWNLNLDHGETIKRTSGSPIVAEGNDFNVTVTTEIGEALAFGPYAVLFAGYADLSIKWTLEFRSTNPGIADGDIFVHNDPWVATNHANDACVYAPLFWEGELFAWVYSCAHHRDVGGPVSGSINPNATSAFDEASLFPPTKLVERGHLREDIFDIWTRRSRLPEFAALELKSQLAGIRFARGRLTEVVERYGPLAVKQAMKKRIAESARIVAGRLSRLPDGVWRDEVYASGATADDVRPYKVCLTFEKRGGRLRVSNEGTDPSIGCLNQTSGGFRGAIVDPLFDALGWDLELCGAGILRQLDFDVAPGKINSAIYPAAVGSSIAMCIVMTQAAHLGAKMVSGDGELSQHAVGVGAIHTVTALGIGGIDQYDAPFASVFMEVWDGGSAGTSARDGIDHAGPAYLSQIPDVEEVERALPVLCLYRESLSDSPAHGRFRGGAGLAAAFSGHGGRDTGILRIGLLTSVTLGKGVDGAWPSTAGAQRYSPQSDVRDWFANGRIPLNSADIGSITPSLGTTQKQFSPFGDSAIYELITQPGGGFGDPISRAPDAVAGDVRSGRLSEADAERVYGVCVSASGIGFDASATTKRRQELLDQRLADSRPPREPCEGHTPVSADAPRAIAGVSLTRDHLACTHCGRHLAPVSGNFRLGCRQLELPLPSISPLFDDPEKEVGEQIVFRQYLCPTCCVALDGDICRPADEPYASFRLSM